MEWDETYIKLKGILCYLYRAVDKLGNTVEFLFTRKTNNERSAYAEKE
ncbi:DDE-type integrase/transposase/recombinase [Flavobacterium johnsoniae]